MSSFTQATVTSVHHWTDSLFSFRTTRDPWLKFINGQFIMVGLDDAAGKRIMRAYSIASANYEDHLEFFSIKVPNGPLTSKLQHLKVGDTVTLSSKPTGTLVIRDLKPGKNLYLLATGTGLAPFLSIIKDPETYEQFEKVILVHCTRQVRELAYRDYITGGLLKTEYLGEIISKQLIYHPTVTREWFVNQGRITSMIESDRLHLAVGMPEFNPTSDRVMICGNPAMTKDCCALLDARGFKISPYIGAQGDYVIERAFVDK